MRMDVHFDEDWALRRSMDLLAECQSTHHSRVKLEEPNVQVQIQTEGTSSGSQRKSGGQDPPIFDGEDEQQQEIC